MSDCRVTKEEAIELLKAYVGNEYYTEKWQETCRMAIDALNGQAEPVRHGEWIKLDECDYQCSECGFRFTSADPISKFEYCRCGARMKGAKDE